MRVFDGRGAAMACLLSAVWGWDRIRPKRAEPAHQARLAEIRAVDQTAVAIGMRIDDRRIVGDDVGGEPPRSWTDAETMTAEARRNMQARQLVDGGDHGNPVGREIDQPAILVRNL